MILTCSYEELRALESGANLLLAEYGTGTGGSVAAPSEARLAVELLRPQLTGPLSIETLARQRVVHSAVALICEGLHDRLEDKVLEHHPAHEEAVALYFDYAHAFAVLNRVEEMGLEMEALIELMTGAPATAHAAETVSFPD